MLPIVERELKVAARGKKLHLWRVRIATVQLLAAGILLLTQNPNARPGGFYHFLATLAFLFCLGEGLRKTADAISEEKREGTLGFLFLTPLRGWDIILGKLAGAAVRSFNGLLAFVPILALTLLLGGTKFGEVFRTVLALGNTLWLSLALCLLISTFSYDRSLGFSILALFATCMLPIAVGQLLEPLGWHHLAFSLSPAWLTSQATDFHYARSPSIFWIGLGFQHLLAWIAVIVASLALPRLWRIKESKSSSQKIRPRTPGTLEQAQVLRRSLLEQSPILWLAWSARDHRLFRTVFFGVALVALFFGIAAREVAEEMFSFALFVLTLVFYLFLASQASRPLAESKRNGAMELLLSTPLKVADIVRGNWLALKRMFLPALIILGGGYLLGAVYRVLVFQGLVSGNQTADFFALLWRGKALLELFLGFWCVGWVGMWMGLSSKTPNRAFIRTVLLALLLPYIFCLPTIISQVILIVLARDKVTWQFRRFIAERYLQGPGFTLPPVQPPPNPPPAQAGPDLSGNPPKLL